jgi:predicted HTH transcriptional regulator
MKAEDYRPARTAKPKPKGNLSRRKKRMLAVSQEWKPITSSQLRETYFSKTEWARKLIPQLKKEERK